MKIGFIGLGVMGYPMAGHLARVWGGQEGHEVWVYNRTASRAQQWQQQYGGKVAVSPAELARHCDFFFLASAMTGTSRRSPWAPRELFLR